MEAFPKEKRMVTYLARGVLLIPVLIFVFYIQGIGGRKTWRVLLDPEWWVTYHVKAEYLDVTDDIRDLNQNMAANKLEFSFEAAKLLSTDEKKTKIAEMKQELTSLDLEKTGPESARYEYINYQFAKGIPSETDKLLEILQPLSKELLLVYIQQLEYLSNCPTVMEEASDDYETLNTMFDCAYDILFKRNRILHSLSKQEENPRLSDGEIVMSKNEQIEYFYENERLFSDFVKEIEALDCEVYFNFEESEGDRTFGTIEIGDDVFPFHAKEIQQHHKFRYIVRKLVSDGVICGIGASEETPDNRSITFWTQYSNVHIPASICYYEDETEIQESADGVRLSLHWYYS